MSFEFVRKNIALTSGCNPLTRQPIWYKGLAWSLTHLTDLILMLLEAARLYVWVNVRTADHRGVAATE